MIGRPKMEQPLQRTNAEVEKAKDRAPHVKGKANQAVTEPNSSLQKSSSRPANDGKDALKKRDHFEVDLQEELP